ncbi:MAG: TolC family protein [Bacteroidota bacterium]
MKNYVFLLLMLFSFPVQSQIQFSSFQEVLDYADEHALAIQSAELGEQIALSEKKEARTYLLPSIGGSLGYNDNLTLQPTLIPAQLFNPEAPEGSFQEATFGTKYQYNTSLQAQWDILNFQKTFAFQTAKMGVEESMANTELSRFNTYNQLASTYYSILLTQESIRIYKENVELSASIFELSEKKYQEGLLSEAEVNRAAIKKLQNKRNLDMAQNNLSQFYIQMQGQLNTKEEIKISDSPDTFKLAQTSIMFTHPEVLWQEAKLKSTESMLKQSKAARIPSLSLIYQNNQIWATDNFMDFANATRLPNQTIGVSLNLSGLFGLSNKHKIKQSQTQLQMQKIQLDNTKLLKAQEDNLLQLQWEQASEQLRDSKEILALQAKNDIHAENTYESGLISLSNRLDQYDDLLASQDNYLQSLASLSLAQYKIYLRQIDFTLNK